jgi:hypothetical protein
MLPVHRLVDALEKIHAGQIIIRDTPRKTNVELAKLMFLSINTVKVLHPLAPSEDRRQQPRPGRALGGVDHGFRPDHNRIDHWCGGP